MNILSLIVVTDRAKIENLPNLIDLSINQNPLGIIPPFNNTKIQFLSLQDTSLTSAEFPSSYNNSILRTISLSKNKIRSIKENDFLILRNSKLDKLNLDSASISTIDQNAFVPLTQLQSLSLNNNQLKSCEFLSNLHLLSSIKLDENQFTSLPQQLSVPGNIKTYSFIHNSISIIDESSPLYQWSKRSYTNIKIYLANNSFDCCLSLWFIRFLKTSPQFVGDSSLLTCVTPSKFAGKLLINLDPDEMNCGNVPSKLWWTTGRIIGIIFGCAIIISIIIIILVFICIRRHPSRSGYTEIDGIDEDPYNNIDPSLSGGPVFPISDDDYDALSIHTIGGIRRITGSEAPTHTTAEGTYAAEGSQAGDSQIHEAALIPHFH
jgi:hypothetical protein